MTYRKIWETIISHDELNKVRHIRGSDRNIVEQKALAQLRQWDEMWERKLRRLDLESAVQSKEENKARAITKSAEAKAAIDELENILLHTLSVDDTIDWDSLLDKSSFSKNPPEKPEIGLLNKVFFKKRKDKAITAYKDSLAQWKSDKENFLDNQKRNNNDILEKKQAYFDKDAGAIYDYCEMVLSNSRYPDYFPQEWNIEYKEDSKILIIDYSLPDKAMLPTVKTVKYVISRGEFSETKLSETAVNKLYDNLLYQITLRTIHELYEADEIDAIVSIVFNGWVNSADKSTGQDVNACILSVQASIDEFKAINLGKVDPKSCFKRLKGIGSHKLHGLIPVAPIIKIDREDTRFVSAYNVVDHINESENLAAMDWQDFENLVRELFEKEFSSPGSEVKITQASRDGGVDAIAIDSDPIRGGRIVIQAKRYTNIVGVSAVRDLFGTTVNEGAIKGILVTTSDYGPDAYEFAKDKPLTLLNGNELLYLLERHGHKAKIDLKEAKQILAEERI